MCSKSTFLNSRFKKAEIGVTHNADTAGNKLSNTSKNSAVISDFMRVNIPANAEIKIWTFFVNNVSKIREVDTSSTMATLIAKQ